MRVCVDLNGWECDLLYTFTVCPFSANLTGYTEKVGMENFELLKVLGTGGENTVLNFQKYFCLMLHFVFTCLSIP